MKQLKLVLCLMIVGLFAVNAADGNLQLINISPDTSMNLVSVSLEDSVLIDSLNFNEATAYLTVPEGNGQSLKFTSVKYPSQTFELTNLDIQEGQFYQSILNGVISATGYSPNPEGISLDLTATWNTVDTANIANNKMKVNFFHGVSDLVELDVADFVLEYIVDDMSYGEYSATSTEFTKINRDLFITSTDSANTIASRSIDLASINGKTLTIVLSGFIVPSANNSGPVISYLGVDEAGNVFALDMITTVFEELVTNFKNYPNPATNFTFIEFNNSKLSEVTVSVIDLSGRTMSNEAFNLNTGFNKVRIDLPNLPNGLYFLSLSTLGSQSALPLVIAK